MKYSIIYNLDRDMVNAARMLFLFWLSLMSCGFQGRQEG
jgi:hypothetical protein